MAALNYEESAQLMMDAEFRGRIKVSNIKYADFILNEANTVPAHNTRLKWANSVYTNPDMVAQQIQPAVVMDTAVQEAGSAITDEALQTTVETVVNKLM